MYTILIVDDERNEREGIARLIKRYGYDLEIRFAVNGEEALAVCEKERIDILLTDIQMPLMTGLELIEQINQRGWTPVCIIYSAYGEFEYAQNAIRLGVIQYLLKPIKLQEFEKLFQEVFAICDEKKRRKQDQDKLKKTLQSEQEEKEGRELLLFLETGKEPDCVNFINGIYTPVLVSSYSGMVAKYWENYQQEVKDVFGQESILINRGESQFLVLLPPVPIGEEQLIQQCKQMMERSKKKYQSEIFVVAGNTCHTLHQLRQEYIQLAEHLDYQFFTSESTLLYNKNGVVRKNTEMLPLHFEKIMTYARLQDHENMKEEFLKAFDYVEKEEGFSSIYIKYNFSEIAKRCCEVLHQEEQLLRIVVEIYECNSIAQMKELILGLLDELGKCATHPQGQNRLVQSAKQIVQQRYSDCALSVALIAEKLNVSAAYLSTLFKMETGQTLIKYISHYRLEKAKEMLALTNMRVADIAEKVGYFNTSYFISLFKNSVGESPAKYREKLYQHE